MKGQIDGFGRALITISLRPTDNLPLIPVKAWIDTGFNGDLVLPKNLISQLGLVHSGTVKAILADGSQVTLKTYACQLDWFGSQRDLEIVSNDGEYPLLGIGLLLDHDLYLSYRSGEITLI